MRQRITYFQEPSESIDPKLVKVTSDSISTEIINAAREERITVGLTEGLPRELYEVLNSSHELHIRWVTEEDYVAFSPLVMRMSPGLHVFYTPEGQKGSRDKNVDDQDVEDTLCPLLRKMFGAIECSSTVKSFTTLPTERFSHSTTHQYYSQLPSLDTLSEYVHHKLCAVLPPTLSTLCLERLSTLPSAATLSLSYTSIAHALTLTAFFPPTTQPIALTTTTSSTSRLEVGILSVEQATEPAELSLGGFLVVLGEDDHPKATLFSFPSRHHAVRSSFYASFRHPTGLHPTLEIRVDDATPPLLDQGCKLHAHLTMPKTLFLDRYQFTDPLFLCDKNIAALRYMTTPVDLEAPAYTEERWGSTALVELEPPPSNSTNGSFQASIPTHLRYLPPTQNTSGLTSLSLPYPALFWACTSEEGTKFNVNPFDRTHLGYDGLFGPRTVFYHLAPGGGGLERDADVKMVMQLDVPVLDLGGARYVDAGTAVVIIVGFAWVCWCLGAVWRGSGYGSGSASLREGAKEKKMK